MSKKKVAFVTGGASGLGKATVEHFLQLDYNVAFTDLNKVQGEQLAKEYGANAVFVYADVTSEEDILRALDEIRSKFGRVDVCVNCAGIAYFEPVLNRKTQKPHQMDAFQKVMNVNVNGTFNVCRLVAAEMAKNEPDSNGQRGIIVNTASIAAYESHIHLSAYACSKAAVAGMTQPLAKDLSHFGIRVMAIAPGLFDTPMLVKGSKFEGHFYQNVLSPKRAGQPKEFAQLVQACVDNPMLNGQVLRIDGGFRLGNADIDD